MCPIIVFHMEASHLICYANEVTGFYMKCSNGIDLVNFYVSQLDVCYYFQDAH